MFTKKQFFSLWKFVYSPSQTPKLNWYKVCIIIENIKMFVQRKENPKHNVHVLRLCSCVYVGICVCVFVFIHFDEYFIENIMKRENIVDTNDRASSFFMIQYVFKSLLLTSFHEYYTNIHEDTQKINTNYCTKMSLLFGFIKTWFSQGNKQNLCNYLQIPTNVCYKCTNISKKWLWNTLICLFN